MIVFGIDPGLSGAIAWRDGAGIEDIADMPTFQITRNAKNKRDIDAAGLVEIMEKAAGHGAHAFIEQVGAMPGQGSSSMFAFGKGFGIVIGVVAALHIPVTFVPPQTWKKALGVPAGKDGARARASQLLPDAAHYWPLVKHDGRAEAALIAEYGYRKLVREIMS